jgi:hypothetical protein
LEGVNLREASLAPLSPSDRPGIQAIIASRDGVRSNPMPFAIDRIPPVVDREPNNTIATAQKISLPVIINGRINEPGDQDVFEFTGKANDALVVEVQARRLDSPLDSVIKVTDAAGTVIAFSDDREDLMSGLNTHHADSYLMTRLPLDGRYFVHITDTARHGGEEYGYRLRISAPQPDFELRVVPSSVGLALNSSANVSVYAVRKDGFTGPIKVALKNPPPGLTAATITLGGAQAVAQFTIKSGAKITAEPVRLSIAGTAKLSDQEVSHDAVAAEDKMQAFLWRHLVPVSDLEAVVYDRSAQPAPRRVARAKPSPAVVSASAVLTTAPGAPSDTRGAAAAPTPAKPKFTSQQIASRLRQLKLLYEDELLSDDFYDARVAECEPAQ